MKAVWQFVAFKWFIIQVFIEMVTSERRVKVKGVESESYRYGRKEPEIGHS